MIDKYIIFITNNLPDKLDLFYKKVKEFSTIKIQIIDYDDCKSDYIMNILKELKPADLILTICSRFYLTVEEELKKILFKLYNIWFKNIILICPDNDFLLDQKIIEGEKFCFPYSEKCDNALQACHFILYAINLFDKAMIQDRLNDYICNSFREVVYSELLVKKNKGIKKINEELERKNQIDHLTSLYNKKGLFDQLGNEYQRTLRDRWRIENSLLDPSRETKKEESIQYGHKPKGNIIDHYGVFSVMMIDIDNFEKINDKYGFLKGDEIIITLAEIFKIKGMFRKNDIAGRLRSGRFFVLLPETSAANTLLPARRLVNTMKTKAFRDNNTHFFVSISIGISEFHTGDQSYEDIVLRATEALQAARLRETEHIAVYEKAGL